MPFTTEHLAWCETRSLTYCKEDDNSLIGLLRWNNFSNTDAMQWWTMVPHGFGIYFDIHAGSQWFAIAASHTSPDDRDATPFDPDLLATPDIFPCDFVPTAALDRELIHPEAILVREGTRMFVSMLKNFSLHADVYFTVYCHPTPYMQPSPWRIASAQVAIIFRHTPCSTHYTAWSIHLSWVPPSPNLMIFCLVCTSDVWFIISTCHMW